MTGQRLNRSEVEQLLEQAQAMIAALDSGELVARSAMRSRLEGVVAALEVVLGRRSSLVDCDEPPQRGPTVDPE